MATTQYEIPRLGTATPYLHGWLLEALQEGDAWLAAQRPTIEWAKVLDMLGPSDPTAAVAGLSNTGYNKGKRIARELVAAISNFRHAGEFKVEFDQALFSQAHVLTKLDHAWERRTFARTIYRQALQYAVTHGTGYLVQDYAKDFWGPGHGDIRLTAYAPQQVTFLQLPADHNMQRAYAVIIREELPINLAKRIYRGINTPFADALVPDREQESWMQKGLRKIQTLLGGSPALRVAGTRADKGPGGYPTVDLFHMYLLDGTINETGHRQSLGTFGTNWAYSVPFLGEPLPIGVTNPATGAPLTRPAEAADCALFPLRRLCIFSKTGIAYDGSSPWWHGHAPLVRLRFNDWAWEALGQSLLGDVRTMQDGIEAVMRDIEDSMAARLDPPILYDDQQVSESFAKAFQPRKAGVRAAATLSAGEVLKLPIQPSTYDVPTWITEHLKAQEGRMDYLTGVQDLTAIAKARQIPGADTLEKLLEMAGPLVQDMVGGLEQPLYELGEMRKAYYYQFYTYPRILQVVGVDEASEDYQFTPDLILPVLQGEGPEARRDRAQLHLHQFHYHITSTALSEMHRLSTRLFYLQLMKMGFPISWWDYAKIAEMPNFGPEPLGTNNMMERWVAQKHMEADLAKELGIAMGKGAGRPPSGKGTPRIEQKDGGTRSTVASR
jgi:hypothetical protein